MTERKHKRTVLHCLLKLVQIKGKENVYVCMCANGSETWKYTQRRNAIAGAMNNEWVWGELSSPTSLFSSHAARIMWITLAKWNFLTVALLALLMYSKACVAASSITLHCLTFRSYMLFLSLFLFLCSISDTYSNALTHWFPPLLSLFSSHFFHSIILRVLQAVWMGQTSVLSPFTIIMHYSKETKRKGIY